MNPEITILLKLNSNGCIECAVSDHNAKIKVRIIEEDINDEAHFFVDGVGYIEQSAKVSFDLDVLTKFSKTE